MQYWLIKSEPKVYSYDDLLKEKRTYWDGVRNYQARNNLKLMKEGDLALYYHSVTEKSVVGIAKVVKEFYQDPTTDDSRWVAVDIIPHQAFIHPVSLEQFKHDSLLQSTTLVKQGRLSVMPFTKETFDRVVDLGMHK